MLKKLLQKGLSMFLGVVNMLGPYPRVNNDGSKNNIGPHVGCRLPTHQGSPDVVGSAALSTRYCTICSRCLDPWIHYRLWSTRLRL